MSLQHWQSWGINHFSRKPVPVADHHLSEEMFLNIQSKPPLATIPTSPREKRSAPVSSISHLRKLERATQPSFLQTGQVQSPQQYLSCKASFHHFHQLFCTILNASKALQNFPKLWGPHYSRWECTNAEYNEIITSFDLRIHLQLFLMIHRT